MRAKMLNVREFDVSKDLGISVKEDLLGDFRKKVEVFNPDLMLFSVVEDAFLQSVSMLKAVHDLNICHLVGGVFPTYAPERCFEYKEINMIGLGEGENVIVEVAEAVRLSKPLHNIIGTWSRDSRV